MTRSERATEAARLRAEGLTGTQIAGQMGISKSYAFELVHDPDGTRARERKDSYRGECKDCGSPTCGANGRTGQPVRCAQCAVDHFDLERAENSFHSVVQLHTDTQCLDALRAASQGRGSVSRMEYELWRRSPEGRRKPSGATVQNRFGTWNQGIVRAGLNPNGPRRDNYPRRRDHVAAVVLVAHGMGRLPSYAEYGEYRLDHPDMNLPSPATIRAQAIGFGRRWIDVLRDANDLLEAKAAA